MIFGASPTPAAARRPAGSFFGPFLALFLAGSLPLCAGPFTYQGRLNDGVTPATGVYDVSFSLFAQPNGGIPISGPVTATGLALTNGLLSAVLDFGPSAFDGSGRWLEISVRQGLSPFSVLSPRQAITATPYALAAATLTAPVPDALIPANIPRLNSNQVFSSSTAFAGQVLLTNTANVIYGSVVGDGAAITNISASALRRTITPSNPWNGTNYVLDFASDVVQITPADNINFAQSANRPGAGFYSETVWYIQPGPTNRLITFNPSWLPIGSLAAASPCLLLSNKTAMIAFAVRGPGETNVTYAVARQE